MAPGSATEPRAGTPPPEVEEGKAEIIGGDDEYGEEEEAAASHLPFAPSSSELCDTDTTVDPSYIISLIRQLLPRNVEKQDMIEVSTSAKEPIRSEDYEDLNLQGDLSKGNINDGEFLAASIGNSNTCHRLRGGEKACVPDNKQAELLDIKDPWEDSGCILWDLSASKTHADLMVNNFLLDVLLASLHVSRSPRVTEICLGIIGNLTCYEDLSMAIISKDDLVETAVQQLFLDDSTCLAETFRLLSVGLQGSRFASWAEALLSDQVLLRILWIFGNTLNPVLLEKGIDFLLTIINNQEVSSILLQPMIKLGFPNLIASLLAGELSKLGDDNKLERSSILDQVLGLVEALSATDSYSQVIVSTNEILPLVCGVVKMPDKIEIASSCVSATVILANLLVDEQHLVVELSQDIIFLQGLLEILPFVSDDPQARNAFWCIIARLLGQVQQTGTSFSTLQQLTSIFADKSHLIEEDTEAHPLEGLESGPDALGSHKSSASATSLERLSAILEKWISEKSATSGGGFADNINQEIMNKIHKLLRCCQKYVRLEEV